MIGRWNILDRGVRPLVVRTDGTFSLFDHREGCSDGRWVQISDTFLSLFIDGPKRHSMHAMPDGRVFLSRHVLPGLESTPELLFRSVLSFEGTWETPYRGSPYTPPPPVQLSLGGDRTFCANLGPGDDGATIVWSGIWARIDEGPGEPRANRATLDYVVWSVANGVRTMVTHGQTVAELHEDGSMTVAALGQVFYPAPGTVRAEGEEPLASAEEPQVLLDAVVAEPEPEPQPEPPTPSPPSKVTSVRQPRRTSTARSTSPDPDTVELPLLLAAQARADKAAAKADRAVMDRTPHVAAAPKAPSPAAGSLVPVARATSGDGTQVVLVVYADTEGALQVAAVQVPDGVVLDSGPAYDAAAGPPPLPAEPRPSQPASAPTPEADEPPVTVAVVSTAAPLPPDLGGTLDLRVQRSYPTVNLLGPTVDLQAHLPPTVDLVSPTAALPPAGLPPTVDLSAPAPPTRDATQVLPVAVTTVDDGTQVVVVLYTDDDGALQVGAVPAAAPAAVVPV